ncbi:MAG: serine protease Do [Clostridia bacterium]|nr:serine protease Do [Clostridia bacterium]
MSYFNRPPRRPGLLSYIAVALICSFIGGLVAFNLAQRYYHGPQNLPNLQPPPVQDNLGAAPTVTGDSSPVVAIAKQVGPAVVGITATTGRDFFNNPEVKQGSGVIIDGRNGYIVTNNHVIAGAVRVSVSLDEERSYPAEIVGADARSDLAVLRLKAPNLPEARLGDSSRVQVGETVVAIGNPLGREFARSVTVGVISALNREVTVESRPGEQITLRVLQTDAAINPGNSGGALVNLRGEVIGINSVKIAAAEVEGMGFAIPINDVRPIIQELIAKGYVSRPFLGIYNLREITPELAQWYDIPVGVYVGGVFPGGPAAKAGLRPGDIITALDQKKVASYDNLQRALEGRKPGEKITVKVVRLGEGNTLQFTLTLGEMPRD